MNDKRKRRKEEGAATGADEGGGTPPPPSDSPMDVRLLEQIVKLMAANDLNTVDLRDGKRRVILKRGAAAPAVTYAMPAHAPTAPPPPSQPQTAASASRSAPGAAAPSDETGLLPIKAEMVGTFYAAPKPGEKPFVSVGSEVDEDTEVCLIEAMKNYFAVKAGVSGTIARILVQDGQTVQFDQPLFLVRPR